jgi:hypothetical protein
MTQQTSTPLSLLTLPSKDALCREFVGKKLSTLRTPALIVDKSRFKRNCERVTGESEKRGMKFRAHVKSKSSIPSVAYRTLRPEESEMVRFLVTRSRWSGGYRRKAEERELTYST